MVIASRAQMLAMPVATTMLLGGGQEQRAVHERLPAHRLGEPQRPRSRAPPARSPPPSPPRRAAGPAGRSTVRLGRGASPEPSQSHANAPSWADRPMQALQILALNADVGRTRGVCVRFDELVLKIPGDELRVKFHPRMTVLSGLGAPERRALSESILGALAGGGGEATALRYVDSTGRLVNVLSGPGGSVQARHDDDGTPAPALRARLHTRVVAAPHDRGGRRPRRGRSPHRAWRRTPRAPRGPLVARGDHRAAAGGPRRGAPQRRAPGRARPARRPAPRRARRRRPTRVRPGPGAARTGAGRSRRAPVGHGRDRSRPPAPRPRRPRHAPSRRDGPRPPTSCTVAVERFGGAERLDADELAAAAALPRRGPGGLGRSGRRGHRRPKPSATSSTTASRCWRWPSCPLRPT